MVTSQSYSVVHSLSKDSTVGPSSLMLADFVRYEVAGAVAPDPLVDSGDDLLARFLACDRDWWASPLGLSIRAGLRRRISAAPWSGCFEAGASAGALASAARDTVSL